VSTLDELTVPKIEQTGPVATDGFVYVDISSVDNKTKRIVDPKHLPVTEAPSRARQRLRAGDVLVSMTRPNLNAVAIVPPELDGSIGSTGFHVLRAKDDVDPRWLFNAVQSRDFIETMEDFVQGALYPAVRPKDIRGYELHVPALEEQRRVLDNLEKQFSRLDEAVANLQRVKANLKRYTDSVYAEVFGEEPNCTLGDLIEEGPQNGLYLPKEMYGEGVPILRIDDYQTAWIRPLTELRRVKAATDQIATWSLREGDLVINRVNSMTHLGKCALIPAALVGTVFESNMMRMRLNNDVLPKYVEHYLASRLGKTRLTKNAKWAVNQASINQKDVRATPIFVPAKSVQQEIVADVDRRLSIIKGTEILVGANIKRARALRQSVLSKSFVSQ
jgi:type I restriction enzyme S subunit